MHDSQCFIISTRRRSWVAVDTHCQFCPTRTNRFYGVPIGFRWPSKGPIKFLLCCQIWIIRVKRNYFNLNIRAHARDTGIFLLRLCWLPYAHGCLMRQEPNQTKSLKFINCLFSTENEWIPVSVIRKNRDKMPELTSPAREDFYPLIVTDF